MNKIKLIVTSILAFTCAVNVHSAQSIEDAIVLYVGYEAPWQNGNSHQRTKPYIPTVYINGRTLTFPAFRNDFDVDIIDTQSGEIVYTSSVSSGETSFIIPQSIVGNYIIEFQFSNVTYWGYINLY